MNRNLSLVLLAVALFALFGLLSIEASPAVNPFRVLKNYHAHMEAKLVTYKNAFRKSHRDTIQHAARGVRHHFATLSDLNGTFDTNSTDDYNFDNQTDLADASPTCASVWENFTNFEALGNCGMEFVSFVTDPSLTNKDLEAYCNSSDTSCYNLFDDLISQLYEHCSDQDLDNLDLNGLSFSELTALRLPCYEDDSGHKCFADAVRMSHTFMDNLPENAAALTALLDTYCTSCVLDLLWELSQTTGSNDDQRVSYYLLSNMCLKDNNVYCLVTLEELHAISTNYTLSQAARAVKSIELVCSNNCFDMYVNGLVGAYESAGGVDSEGNRVDVSYLSTQSFDFCDRAPDGQLCAVKIFQFMDSQGTAVDSCPFGYQDSTSTSGSGGESSVPIPSGANDTTGASSASGTTGTDSSDYSGGDGLGSGYELPEDANFDGFDSRLNESTCNDQCKKFIASFVQAAGCCIGSLFQNLEPTADFTASQAFDFFQNECGNDVPDPCSAQGLVEGTLNFENLDINFVRAHEEDFRLYVRLDLAFALAIDKDNIKITFLKETNAYNHYLMAAGVSVGYSIITPDTETRDRVAGDLLSKIQSGKLNLASINNLPTAARVNPTKDITVASSSSVSTKTRAVVRNASGSSTLFSFTLSAVVLLLANLFFLA